MLWKNGISADVMYESGLTGNEDQMALCDDEGILFVFDILFYRLYVLNLV